LVAPHPSDAEGVRGDLAGRQSYVRRFSNWFGIRRISWLRTTFDSQSGGKRRTIRQSNP